MSGVFQIEALQPQVDSSKSIRCIVSDLIDSAFARQRECPGTMVAGAVMQHLVGAKIETALPKAKIKHEGFAVADAPAEEEKEISSSAIQPSM